MTQKRIIALDIGDKRIGVAVSDETNTIAFGVCVIERSSIQKDIKQIADYAKEYNIDKLIVGLPLNLKGKETIQTKKVNEFVAVLKENLSIPLETFDERFSTMQCEKFLISADVSREKRKKVLDKMAAQVILQTYLDMKGKGQALIVE